MKKLTLLITLIVILMSPYAYSIDDNESPNIRGFINWYSSVQTNLKNDSGKLDIFKNMLKKNPDKAEFIADYWQTKLRICCSKKDDKDLTDSLWATVSLARSGKITQEESKNRTTKLMDEYQKELISCFNSFYYDNWNEINKTIGDN